MAERQVDSILAELKLSGGYRSLRDLDNATLQLSKIYSQIFADGNGANQAQILFDDIRTLAAGVSEELDLFDGSLKDAFGGGLVFSSIKAMLICAIGASGDPANISPVRIGGAIANAWEPWTPVALGKLDIFPGGAQMFVAPDATGLPVDVTNKLLKVENPSGGSDAIFYTIVALGVGTAT